MKSQQHIRRADVDTALELYSQHKIDLEGLCYLMASYGARSQEQGFVDLNALAEELSLFVHERMTMQASGAKEVRHGSNPSSISTSDSILEEEEGPKTVHISPPSTPSVQRSPLTTHDNRHPDDAGEEEQRTVMLQPTDKRELLPKAQAQAKLWQGETPLTAFCRERNIHSRLSPGLTPDAPSLDAEGDARYAIGRRLGQGGVGRVDMAVDRELRRVIAIKRLREEALNDPIQLQAFLEEAMINGGLEHPNIAPVYELGYSESLGPYYTMKRLKGRALSHILRALRKEDEETLGHWNIYRLLDVFREICRAIAFAHDRGVIHCDLKPANVLVGDFGEVSVVDWGLARLLGEAGRGQARALLTSGTPAYMPPEQAVGSITDLDEQTDIWALGAILYELLTLTVAFEGETSEETVLMLVADPVEPPSQRAPQREIPRELERICMQALEKKKLMRYPSVREMLSDIDAFLEGRREELRRDEAARQALDEFFRITQNLARSEAEVDELQDKILQLPPLSRERYDMVQQLNGARDDLVFGYGDATSCTERGLEARPNHGGLRTEVGLLYWKIFGRLYPARVPAEAAVRGRATDLLTRLAKLAFSEIVEYGRTLGTDSASASSDDPWLDAVLSFCGAAMDVDQSRAPSAMLPLIERIAFLKGVSLFAGLRGADLLPIAEASQRRDFGINLPIFRQGDPGDALYVVVRGKIEILRDNARLNVLQRNDCFGEIAVLDQAPRTASAICLTPVTCLVLTASSFREILREKGDIGLAVINVLTERMRQATAREASLRSSLGHE